MLVLLKHPEQFTGSCLIVSTKKNFTILHPLLRENSLTMRHFFILDGYFYNTFPFDLCEIHAFFSYTMTQKIVHKAD